jgi:pSer/pThr/pTyr-binding forkhead associated (FHA) protein
MVVAPTAIMNAAAQLVLRQDPARVAPLNPGKPLTIGRAGNNQLCLASWDTVAPHHAVVRYAPEHGWLVCDWGSPMGTYCRGRRVQRCQPLRDGDAIALGRDGPVLLFQQLPDSTAPPTSAPAAAAIPGPAAALRSRLDTTTAAAAPLAPPQPPLRIADRELPLAAIRSAEVLSRPRHPHSFSWWVLACLGGLVLLPWVWLFWLWQIAALAAWILLGARKEHVLILTLRDGMAHRHRFVNRGTALAHRNGVRRAIGQPLGS